MEQNQTCHPIVRLFNDLLEELTFWGAKNLGLWVTREDLVGVLHIKFYIQKALDSGF